MNLDWSFENGGGDILGGCVSDADAEVGEEVDQATSVCSQLDRPVLHDDSGGGTGAEDGFECRSVGWEEGSGLVG